MKNLFKTGKFIIIVFAILWLFVGMVLILWEKSEIHLFVNKYHTPFFDCFFKWNTNLGDGLMPLILFVVFSFFSFRKAFIVGLSGAVSGLLAQFFKRVVFKDIVRPKAFFNEVAELYLVPGVDIHSSFSFPSGHSATVFGLFIVLALFAKNKTAQVALLVLAIVTGFSRIYLSQHFLIDVYFGAILGIIASFFTMVLIDKVKSPWIDYSILKLFNKRNE